MSNIEKSGSIEKRDSCYIKLQKCYEKGTYCSREVIEQLNICIDKQRALRKN